jgi:hypothetical protein
MIQSFLFNNTSIFPSYCNKEIFDKFCCFRNLFDLLKVISVSPITVVVICLCHMINLLWYIDFGNWVFCPLKLPGQVQTYHSHYSLASLFYLTSTH